MAFQKSFHSQYAGLEGWGYSSVEGSVARKEAEFDLPGDSVAVVAAVVTGWGSVGANYANSAGSDLVHANVAGAKLADADVAGLVFVALVAAVVAGRLEDSGSAVEIADFLVLLGPDRSVVVPESAERGEAAGIAEQDVR